MAPANRSPTEMRMVSPSTTSMMLGGMRMPSVPVDAMIPVASFGS